MEGSARRSAIEGDGDGPGLLRAVGTEEAFRGFDVIGISFVLLLFNCEQQYEPLLCVYWGEVDSPLARLGLEDEDAVLHKLNFGSPRVRPFVRGEEQDLSKCDESVAVQRWRLAECYGDGQTASATLLESFDLVELPWAGQMCISYKACRWEARLVMFLRSVDKLRINLIFRKLV